ncbi:hypothetical protein K438DRAFT_1989334 [Mycena galopus ATCC 62051]|nr:hypothetical protein K438DRAFT_1989334 [Mycena galopus ATCC 62051]
MDPVTPSKNNDSRALFDDENPSAVVATPNSEFTPNGHSTPFTSPSHDAANTKAPDSTNSYRIVSDFADQGNFFVDWVLDGDDPILLLQLPSFRDDGEMAQNDTDMITILSGMDENEEDKLFSSPTAPLKSLRLLLLLQKLQPKQPLAVNPANPFLVEHMPTSGLVDYPSSEEEDEDVHTGQLQVGGGYPRLEASLLADPPAVCLRSNLRTTEKASPTAFDAVRRRVHTVQPSTPLKSASPVANAECESLSVEAAGPLPRPAPHPAWKKGRPGAAPAPAPDNAGAAPPAPISCSVSHPAPNNAGAVPPTPIPVPENAGAAPRAPRPQQTLPRKTALSHSYFLPPPADYISTDSRGGNGGGGNDAGCDGGDDGDADDSGSDGSGPAKRGRFSAQQQLDLKVSFKLIQEVVNACAEQTNLSASHIITTYVHQARGVISVNTRAGQNTWNQYQSYANSSAVRRLAEHCRLNADFTVEDEDEVPRLTQTELGAAYKLFQKTYTVEEVHEILSTAVQLVKQEQESIQSLHQWQAAFIQDKKNFTTMANRMWDNHHFEFFGVMIGAHVNEVSELGGIIVTEGLASLINDLSLCEDDFIAAAKLTAYQRMMYNIQIVDIPPAGASGRPSVTSPSPVPAAGDSKSCSKRGPMCASMREKVRGLNNVHQSVIKVLSGHIGEACNDDVGINLLFKANKNFACIKTMLTLRNTDTAMIGYPAGVWPLHLPPTGKATGTWHNPNVDEIATSLDARAILGQGLHFECLAKPYQSSDYVIFSHKYRIPAPTSSSSSAESISHCAASSLYDAASQGHRHIKSRVKPKLLTKEPEEEEPMSPSPPPLKKCHLSETPESEECSPSPALMNRPVTHAQAKDKAEAMSSIYMPPPPPPVVNISDLSDIDNNSPLATSSTKGRTRAQTAPDAKRTQVASPRHVLGFVVVPLSPHKK